MQKNSLCCDHYKVLKRCYICLTEGVGKEEDTLSRFIYSQFQIVKQFELNQISLRGKRDLPRIVHILTYQINNRAECIEMGERRSMVLEFYNSSLDSADSNFFKGRPDVQTQIQKIYWPKNNLMLMHMLHSFDLILILPSCAIL